MRVQDFGQHSGEPRQNPRTIIDMPDLVRTKITPSTPGIPENAVAPHHDEKKTRNHVYVYRSGIYGDKYFSHE